MSEVITKNYIGIRIGFGISPCVLITACATAYDGLNDLLEIVITRCELLDWQGDPLMVERATRPFRPELFTADGTGRSKIHRIRPLPETDLIADISNSPDFAAVNLPGCTEFLIRTGTMEATEKGRTTLGRMNLFSCTQQLLGQKKVRVRLENEDAPDLQLALRRATVKPATVETEGLIVANEVLDDELCLAATLLLYRCRSCPPTAYEPLDYSKIDARQIQYSDPWG